ncbi:MAG: hypothetical protein ACHQK9_15350 [Reyranellales bacterium]
MKKLWLVLVGVAILTGLATIFPLATLVGIAMESLRPQRIDWEAKNAWAKCDGAIGGKIDWPSQPGLACAAMHMCANEASLSPQQHASLVSAARRLPGCDDP